MSNWTLFSNHGHVLFCLSRDQKARLRDVAADVGITERAVQKIVRDLQDAGMISVTKNGRRNSYSIHQEARLRHDIEAGCSLNDLLKVVNRRVIGQQVSNESQDSDKGTVVKQPVSATQPLKSTSTATAPKNDVSPLDDEPSAKNIVKGNVKDKAKKDSIQKKLERQQGTLF